MLDNFMPGGNQPTEITIRPVKNGWILHLPEVKDLTDQFNGIGPMMKGIVDGIREAGDTEIETLIKNATKDVDREENKLPKYTRDNNLYIFKNFGDLIIFLAITIEEDATRLVITRETR